MLNWWTALYNCNENGLILILSSHSLISVRVLAYALWCFITRAHTELAFYSQP